MSVIKNNIISEGLEHGDLKRLVLSKIHIDEFKSKIGNDEDICVLSLKIKDKSAANDLVNFIEKGYDWVLDADTSTGEFDDGDYIVFVETERNKDIPKNIINFIEDLINLTHNKISDWKVWYYKDKSDYVLSLENLENIIPLSPAEYNSHFKIKKDSTNEDIERLNRRLELNSLKSISGAPVAPAPESKNTELIKIWAGLK